MIRDRAVSLRSSPLELRERVLRRNAEALNDPDLREKLLRLADRCAEHALIGTYAPADKVLAIPALEQVELASRFMDEALRLLDINDCTLPASKLAEAIEDLNLAIVSVRELGSVRA